MDPRSTLTSTSSRRRFLAMVGLSTLAGCNSPLDLDAPTIGPETDVDDAGGTTETEPPADPYEHPTLSEDPAWTVPTDAPSAAVDYDVLVENLEVPWDLAFADSGALFITERTGRVLRFDSGTVSRVVEPRDAIDAGSVDPGTDESSWWVEGGEGGTLGVAAHPEFPDEPYLYVYYTASTMFGIENRVVRYDLDASDPAATETVLVDGIEADNIHNGGRIRFGPDDNLWITTGDAGTGGKAGDTAELEGKVLRITPDGEAPPSNPDLGGDPRVFTYGHRNPQGIDWLPDGVPLVSEHGPAARDEVNFLRPGANYGWPIARGGPDDDAYGSYPDHEVDAPVLNTGPHDVYAPTGATFYTGTSLPSWQNRFVVGGLVSQSIWVVTLTPPDYDRPPVGDTGRVYDEEWLHPTYTATVHQRLPDELGRVRHVAQSPDGDLYAITSNRDGRARSPFPTGQDDVLVRLTPE